MVRARVRARFRERARLRVRVGVRVGVRVRVSLIITRHHVPPPQSTLRSFEEYKKQFGTG